jgi:hypothetical protein
VRVRMGLYEWARMVRFIPTELGALPDILDKGTADRVGPEMTAERAGLALNVLPLTTSSHVEAA